MKAKVSIAICIFLVAYATILFIRGEDQVNVVVFRSVGFGVFPRLGAYAVYLVFCVFFTAATIFLVEGYRLGWMRSINVWEKNFAVTPQNQEFVIRSLWMTGTSLVLGLAATLIPDGEFRLVRIEICWYFLVGGIGSIIPSLWARIKLERH